MIERRATPEPCVDKLRFADTMQKNAAPRQTSSMVPVSAGPKTRRATTALWILGLVFAIACLAAMKAMSIVMIPLVFAVLLALVMAPFHARLAGALPDKLGWLSLVAIMAVLLAVLFLFLSALVFAGDRLAEAIAEISGNLETLLPKMGEGTSPFGGRLGELWGTVTSSVGSRMLEGATSFAKTIAAMTGAFVTTTAIVFFLVLLALSERGIWGTKICALWPDEGQHSWANAIATVTARLRRFLVVRTGVGLLQAALYAGWLALFGVDLVFVFAVITFILTYIPNVGSVISSILPVGYVLITKDFGTALMVAGGLLVIEQVVGNFLDPKLMGREIVLSPFVILVALLFWGALWGVAGAFLSTPIMLSLLVAFNHVEPLRPVALVLSNQPTPEALDEALNQK